MEPNFIHLRLHTEYSLSDGIVTIPALMEKATTFGMPSIAITDKSNLYGIVKFYQCAFENGIKPIIGVDLWMTDEQHKEKFCLPLLCQNQQGYRNLLKLVSHSYLRGQSSGTPLAQKTWLAANSSGLIALSGGIEGDIGQAILANNLEKAESCIQFWITLFPSRFYIEVSRTGKQEENEYFKVILKLAQQYNLPVVATNNVRFLLRDDFEAHEARVCIQEGITLNDTHRKRTYTDQQYFRSPSEMQTLFADIPYALKNTVEIAKRCNVIFSLGQHLLPHFPVPSAFTPESYLIEKAKIGLNQRLNTLFANDENMVAAQREPYDARLTQELAVINKMGFAGYFLIVADFTHWAKTNDIPVGPGRGSGPGSLVAYSLKITDLDPLPLELLFERFLNPERVSMPDFDIDFCMQGRDKVIEYVMNTHGHDSVSQIMTYGTMAAKAVVRDVGRVLGLSYSFVDKIAKLIPFELGITLEKALDQEPLLRERYYHEEEVKNLIDLAKKLEGITRNVGKHAGGIVIAPGKLLDFVPLYCEPNEPAHVVTQFDKDDVELIGLVKFDFLGLKTLTIIDRTLKVINQTTQTPIDISLIALDDQATFKLLKACKSTAVFQLESHGMRDLIKRLQPDCFEDLIALVALFRPGPLQSGMVDDFINRKHGRAKVTYAHPKLEPILKSTYGVILYQEQVMQIAQVLAGYTLGAADILRRAMGKKKPEEMAKQREIFCRGAKRQQIGIELANYIFDLMEKFAGYGFNKSHSASYALIAYQTAWLKTHYPAAFMSAVLSSDMDRTEKIIVFLDECSSMKLHVSPPDINKSTYFFHVIDENNLMHGLGAIKGVGEAAIESIQTARNAAGAFKNLFDFCQRVDIRKVNRRVLEALIKSGCFDNLNPNRAELIASINKALQYAEQALHNATYGQHDLLGVMTEVASPDYIATDNFSEDMQLKGEKETLGFYLTGHPLKQYLTEIANFTTCRILELEPGHKSARVAGIINNIRTRQTKRGDRMGIFSLDDGTTQLEVVCFSDIYQKHRHLFIEDQILLVEGEVNIDEFNNNPRLLARDIFTLDEGRQRYAKKMRIILNKDQLIDGKELQQILTKHSGGSCTISLRYLKDNAQADIQFGKKWLVAPTSALLNMIKEQLNVQLIELVYNH